MIDYQNVISAGCCLGKLHAHFFGFLLRRRNKFHVLNLFFFAFDGYEVSFLSPSSLLFDYRFNSAYLFLLKIIFLLLGFFIFEFLILVKRVVSVIEVSMCVLKLKRLVCYLVKEESVMGYDYQSIWILIQVRFKPFNCADIQMVCRLVKNKQVRL